MHDTTLAAAAAGTAVLTLGLSAYAALIFAGIALAIYEVRRHRRGRAIAAAAVVTVLTLAGLVAAIVSSVA